MAAEQDNAAVVRRFWDLVWNNGELPAIEELVDDDFTNFGIRRPGGHAAVRYIVTAWRTAFPDLQMEVEEEIACGDTVVHRVTARGTHLGEFPPGIGPGRVLDAMGPPAVPSKPTRCTFTGSAAARSPSTPGPATTCSCSASSDCCPASNRSASYPGAPS